MISWFTESSLVPLILGTMIGFAFLGLAISFRDRVMFLIAVVVGILTAGTAITEVMIVTDRETITELVQTLAHAVETNNMEQILSHVSDQRDDAKARIRAEMPKYKFRSCRIIGIRNFSSTNSGPLPTAEIDFVVLASGSHQHDKGTVHRRVILYLEKEADGNWRLIDYQHTDPQSGISL